MMDQLSLSVVQLHHPVCVHSAAESYEFDCGSGGTLDAE